MSAGLTALSGNQRSMSVGLTKEMLDSTPGGTGFSFVDLMADRAGTLFAAAATLDSDAARRMQSLLSRQTRVDLFMPEIDGLPERIRREEFQKEFGGLNGPRTRELVAEIRARLDSCEGLVLAEDAIGAQTPRPSDGD